MNPELEALVTPVVPRPSLVLIVVSPELEALVTKTTGSSGYKKALEALVTTKKELGENFLRLSLITHIG